MGTAMFHTPIKAILLVIIHSSKNKTERVDGFAVIFDGIVILTQLLIELYLNLATK